MERRHFDGGQTDTAAHIGKGSKLYELNLYAMTLGRPKERAVSVADEFANKRARKAAELARAAAKRRAVLQYLLSGCCRVCSSLW